MSTEIEALRRLCAKVIKTWDSVEYDVHHMKEVIDELRESLPGGQWTLLAEGEPPLAALCEFYFHFPNDIKTATWWKQLDYDGKFWLKGFLLCGGPAGILVCNPSTTYWRRSSNA